MSLVAAAAIREWREAHGLSQTVCAKRIGVAQSAWNQWESGKGEPRIRFAVRLAELTEGRVPVSIWNEVATDESGPLPEAPAATGTDDV